VGEWKTDEHSYCSATNRRYTEIQGVSTIRAELIKYMQRLTYDAVFTGNILRVCRSSMLSSTNKLATSMAPQHTRLRSSSSSAVLLCSEVNRHFC